MEKDRQIEVQQKLSPELNILADTNWNNWMQEAADRINKMIVTDFAGLVNLLYRMDVSERKLKAILAGNPHQDAGLVIAELMVERQLEKIRSRRQYRSSNDIPDDEKW